MVGRADILDALAVQIHANLKIRDECCTSFLTNFDRVPDMIIMSVCERHMGRAFRDIFDITLKDRIAGQEWVDHDNRISGFNAKGRMAEPGNLHFGFAPRKGLKFAEQYKGLAIPRKRRWKVVAVRAREQEMTAQKTSSDLSLDQFAELLPANGAIAGLDLGTKTIGIAVSDIRRVIASPLVTIRRTKFGKDAEELLAVCSDRDISGLVIGLPLNMDGSEGPRVQATRAFARNLRPLTELPITFWDERMSTMAVTRTLLDADTSRKRRSELVDKMAASYILQGALDRMANL